MIEKSSQLAAFFYLAEKDALRIYANTIRYQLLYVLTHNCTPNEDTSRRGRCPNRRISHLEVICSLLMGLLQLGVGDAVVVYRD